MSIPIPVQTRTGREKVLPTLVAMATEMAAMRAMLEEVLSRPPQVVVREWKPDHRRLKDGGEHVRTQRKRMRP